ncbi:MAG: YciI family protein [Anaerolineae bacterium]|nr:YciI family protein [Anaerolineae bacterium]
MEYLLLIYSDEREEADLTPEQREAMIAPYIAFAKETRERGMYVTGSEAYPSSQGRTVRVRDGRMIAAEGAFAPGSEQVGGFYILKCEDIDEACAMAAKLPAAARGAVEVRPLVG